MLGDLNSHGSLPPLAKEIGILATARHFDSDFEW
jgi:hypothetical protein